MLENLTVKNGISEFQKNRIYLKTKLKYFLQACWSEIP